MITVTKLKAACLIFLLIGMPKLALADDIKVSASALFGGLEESLSVLYSNKKLNKENVKEVLRLKLIPASDSKYFAYKILGKHIQDMSAEHKLLFIEELTNNLLSSYANILINYKDERIILAEPKIQPSGKIATVAIEIKGSTKPIKAISKWHINEKLETWLIFDIVIEGVSLLQTKQAEINSSISSKGIDATIKKLQEINMRT
ncbi:MAG: phospholipid transport system substrate-binding protein [Alteromonadaceae bacterium]|jgi:phospholipid transport system substrate-binding protein